MKKNKKEILEQIKKPFKHLLLEKNDDEILDIWKRFDDDYDKTQ